MKYNVLETAAVEASAGLHEIDAEIEQIETRKESLRTIRQSLETVGHELFTTLSLISGDKLTDGGNQPVAPTSAAALESPAAADAQPEVAHDQQEVEAAPVLHQEADSAPLAQEEAPAWEPVEVMADAPAEEHPAFAEVLADAQPEVHVEEQLEAHVEAQPEAHFDAEPDAQPEAPEAHEHEDWETCTPVGVAAEGQETKAPTFKDLLSQSKPYSLRNDGWPACKPVAQRALRDLL